MTTTYTNQFTRIRRLIDQAEISPNFYNFQDVRLALNELEADVTKAVKALETTHRGAQIAMSIGVPVFDDEYVDDLPY